MNRCGCTQAVPLTPTVNKWTKDKKKQHKTDNPKQAGNEFLIRDHPVFVFTLFLLFFFQIFFRFFFCTKWLFMKFKWDLQKTLLTFRQFFCSLLFFIHSSFWNGPSPINLFPNFYLLFFFHFIHRVFFNLQNDFNNFDHAGLISSVLFFSFTFFVLHLKIVVCSLNVQGQLVFHTVFYRTQMNRWLSVAKFVLEKWKEIHFYLWNSFGCVFVCFCVFLDLFYFGLALSLFLALSMSECKFRFDTPPKIYTFLSWQPHILSVSI